ncbi:flavin-binding monooxygenase-like protein-like protein [Leptodontidium sp. MPI-SDFR-AT-0119]|nr:flavin-binding monooxygenase-like protein-like protein [Leptodontidium sp. MPI-SDFR-AT-0119]
MSEATSFEVVIIGAGISGIIAAQRYLQAHPRCKLTVLEKDYCVGGVFSKRRSYDNFWTQWTHGMAEYSDMPMERPPGEDCKFDCFRAKYTTQYLEKYVDDKTHAGRSLRDRIQFEVTVEKVEKKGSKWMLSCLNLNGSSTEISAEKLMVANGECSFPNIPKLPGQESFDGPIIHSESFAESDILASKTVKHITVLAAGKSAADMVYNAVKAGKTVTWIIKKNGTGPGFFASLDEKTPWKNPVEAAHTRVMSSLMPSILNPDNWWTWSLHSTRIGAGIVGRIFSAVDQKFRKLANYRGRPSTKGFEKLEYDTDFFWQNGTGGAVHHDDFWSLVADNVYVYRVDVKTLGRNTITLEDGTTFPCDAILCGTGFQPALQIFNPDLLVHLDLPHKKEDEPPEMTEKWNRLLSEADEKVTKKFLILAKPPPHFHKRLSITPYRLYNCMAPLSDDSILIMNHITAGNKIFAAEAQAMWAVAYFDKKITLPSVEERENEIGSWVAWCRRRYLSNGELGTFAGLDSIPYVDKLLRDIGLDAHRQSWWRDFFLPFGPKELGKAWEQYLESVK